LPKEDRLKLIRKAEKEGVGGLKVRDWMGVLKESPKEIKEAILEEEIEPETAQEILKIEKPEFREEVLEEVKKEQKIKKVKVTPESVEKIKSDLELIKRVDEWKKIQPKVKNKTPEDYVNQLEELLQGTWTFIATKYATDQKEKIRNAIVKTLTLEQLEKLDNSIRMTLDELQEFYEALSFEIKLRKSRAF
jgi:hypothetical protein